MPEDTAILKHFACTARRVLSVQVEKLLAALSAVESPLRNEAGKSLRGRPRRVRQSVLERGAYCGQAMPSQLVLALQQAIATDGREAVVERLATAWFVRLYLRATSELAPEDLGWLYQFWLAERKDAIGRRKHSHKVAPADLPAATQLPTPHWIARFLVENSLGRLWLANRPDSRLAGRMPCYIPPTSPHNAPPPLPIASPEAITICDPACGSGHMLLAAFDLLYDIYLEAGYAPPDIPAKILAHNLYGMDIDRQACKLATASLTMKARQKLPTPNICHLAPVAASAFAEADNFGSLIQPPRDDVAAPHMAKALAAQYHIVITNPPYLGSRAMNNRLREWLTEHYPSGRADLYAAFMERCLGLTRARGITAMLTMQGWMFLKSFASLRAKLAKNAAITVMAHLGAGAFAHIDGGIVATTAFVARKGEGGDGEGLAHEQGTYLRLTGDVSAALEGIGGEGKPDGSGQDKARMAQEAARDIRSPLRYVASYTDFAALPGAPLVYWLSPRTRALLATGTPLRKTAMVRQGLATGNNARFVRLWHEVPPNAIGFGVADGESAAQSGKQWFPYNKGGASRKWYGNQQHVIHWEQGGQPVREQASALVRNEDCYFRPSVSWAKVSTDAPAFRYYPQGFVFDVAGTSLFARDGADELNFFLHFCNSRVASHLLTALAPTLNCEVGQVGSLPVLDAATRREMTRKLAMDAQSGLPRLVQLAKNDWDEHECSWDFTLPPLLRPEFRPQLQQGRGGATLEAAWNNLRRHWQAVTEEMQQLEEANNRLFIEAYGLQSELSPEVPLAEITLFCNPAWRYADASSPQERERLLLADTMREFISWAVGCLFGRFSDGADTASAPANNSPSVAPVTVLPLACGPVPPTQDDAVSRIRGLVRHFFGDSSLDANMAFMEQALGVDLTTYMWRDFFADHVRRYQQRPIYWLFASPGGHFRALAYMHSLTTESVRAVNGLSRRHLATLRADAANLDKKRRIHGTPRPEKKRATRALAATRRAIADLESYSRTILAPLTRHGITIDPDAGVGANYAALGAALKQFRGLRGLRQSGAA